MKVLSKHVYYVVRGQELLEVISPIQYVGVNAVLDKVVERSVKIRVCYAKRKSGV